MCRWKWASLLGLIVPCLALAAGWDRVAASEVLGKAVLARDGTALGQVHDLVLDVRNARVSHAIVGFDGWGQLGEQLFSVPIGDLQPAAQGDQLHLRTDVKALRDGVPHGTPGKRDLPAGAPLRQYIRASQVLGRSVEDRTGRHAGEIEEAVLDLQRGLVLYLLFDYDEAWGLDQAPLRMAPQVFSFPEDGGAAVVNVARGRLEAPGK